MGMLSQAQYAESRRVHEDDDSVTFCIIELRLGEIQTLSLPGKQRSSQMIAYLVMY